mgnify:CR=1 FL=1
MEFRRITFQLNSEVIEVASDSNIGPLRVG